MLGAGQACATPTPHCKPTSAPISIFLAGDVLLGRGVAPFLPLRRTNLQLWKTRIQQADMAFCNLECALQDEPHRSGFQVHLTAPPSSLRYVREAGFNIVSTANNHSLDNGAAGVERLDQTARRYQMATIGSSVNSQLGWPAFTRRINGQRITWLAASNWGPFRRGTARVRPIAGSSLTEQVRALAQRGDRVFVSLHWGHEYVTAPTQGQKQLAHALIDAGAACIVGHHPHCVGPVETYHGRPIFYSLGNFVFDRTPLPQSGLAAVVRIDGDNISFRTSAVNPQPQPAMTSAALPLPAGEKRFGELEGHFLPEALPQRLQWSRAAAGFHWLRLFEHSAGKWRLVAQGSHPVIEAMRRADLDGDGIDEIWLELKQRSKLDVTVRPRLHLYRADARRGFLPLWRGSTLSRAFHEWALLPHPAHGTDLVSLETNATPGLRDFSWLAVYRWNGFGFRRLWDTPLHGQLRALSAGKDSVGPFIQFEQHLNSRIRKLELRPISKDSATQFRAIVKQDWQ